MEKVTEYGCKVIYFMNDKCNSLREELEGQEVDSKELLDFRYIYDLEEILL